MRLVGDDLRADVKFVAIVFVDRLRALFFLQNLPGRVAVPMGVVQLFPTPGSNGFVRGVKAAARADELNGWRLARP